MELTVVGLVQEIKESKISISNILREPYHLQGTVILQPIEEGILIKRHIEGKPLQNNEVATRMHNYRIYISKYLLDQYGIPYTGKVKLYPLDVGILVRAYTQE